MAKNSGKPSESDFEDILSRLGKRAYCYRIVDAAEVRGRTGRIGFIRPAPSDYIVTIDGQTSYSEVKSTTDTSLPAVTTSSTYTPSFRTAGTGSPTRPSWA
jgi:hypothetical protein